MRRRPAAHREALLAFGLAALSLAGCDEPADEAARQPGLEADRQASDERDRTAGPYGPDGELRESERTVAGLTLPAGLELEHEADRRHIYRTDVPIAKVMRYFGPRLLTGQVDPVGEGGIYRRAVPRNVQGGVVKLDVSILPTAAGTKVDIREVRPAPEDPPDLEEIKRRLAEQQRTLE